VEKAGRELMCSRELLVPGKTKAPDVPVVKVSRWPDPIQVGERARTALLRSLECRATAVKPTGHTNPFMFGPPAHAHMKRIKLGRGGIWQARGVPTVANF